MVRATVDPIDNCVCRALQLVMRSALDESAQHRFVSLVAMEREAGDVGLATHVRHRAVHGLDDVASNAEIAQCRLDVGL